MFIRRAFTTLHEVQSEALAPVSALIDWTIPDRAVANRAIADWTIDWRWFSEPASDEALPNETLISEGSLINWPSWARLTTPRHG
ncbi:hypothetical protein [Reyranella sp.]|uniref:hypothetical protein n=1 Tax=Reyranella sp. TaxID=1929291 RepID=UPI003783305B